MLVKKTSRGLGIRIMVSAPSGLYSTGIAELSPKAYKTDPLILQLEL